jgi:hypothetical protein
MPGLPNIANLNVNKLVTSYALKHKNHAMIADQVMPPKKSMKTDGVYFKYNREHQTLRDSDIVLLAQTDWRSKSKEIEYDVTSGNYSMKLFGLSEVVGQDQIMDADKPMEPVVDAAINIKGKLDLVKEKQFYDLVGASGNYATGNKVSLANSLQWSTYGTATGTNSPIVQVQSGSNVIDRKAGAVGRKVMVVSPDTHLKLIRHPEFVDGIKYTTQATKGSIENAIAGILGVDGYMIMKAIRSATAENLTASMTYIASDFACLLAQPEMQTVKSVAFAIQFQRAGVPVVQTRVDEDLKGATVVEMYDEYVFELVDNTAGYLWLNTV